MNQYYQIETFGSVEREYKVDYILFQMKILLLKGDYIRMYIVSNKINRKHLGDEKLENLKVEFYQMMILYYLHENKFIEVSKCYKVLYDFYCEIELKMKHSSSENLLKAETADRYRNIMKNLNKKILLVNYVMYLTICPPELETKNMLNELNLHYRKDLEENPDIHSIVTKHLSDDIVPVTDNFFKTYSGYPIFVKDQLNPKADEHLRLFRKYLIQHNLAVYSKYFSQCHLKRISQMIEVDIPEIENEICDMVVNKFIYAKINRISGTVNFKPKQDYGDKLNDLNFDLNKMLEKIETTCHLIHKENLKYEIK
jgi:26S proteasome regulatory subunit N5